MVKWLYADTSAVVAAYLADEPEHNELRALLLESDAVVFTSQLTRVEFASALTAAKRAGRIPGTRHFLDRFSADTAPGQAITLLPFVPDNVIPAAQRLVMENYPLRTLDAMHLAVLMRDTAPLTGGEPVVMVTRDKRQAEAARANGLKVR